jgi:predicted methyltransferase
MAALTLSHFEVAPLLQARAGGLGEAVTSGDLGRTQASAAIAADGARFGDVLLPWAWIERIHGDTNKCFRADATGLVELRVFSAATGWVRSLFPTGSAPASVVGGFTMHRIRGVDPNEDTRRKLAGIEPVAGRVLDTATGLGYTAIAAARHAASVVTIELDPAALELAATNPWSRELFLATNVEQRVGCAAEIVAGLPAGSFDRVLHDPPALQLAGALYSAAFYRDLHRVLVKGGRLSHYVGDPESPSGKRTTRGVVERLRRAGFTRVVAAPSAFGVVAVR